MQLRYNVKVRTRFLCFSYWKTYEVIGHKVETAIVEHGQIIVIRPRLVLWCSCGKIAVISAIDGKDYEVIGGDHGIQNVRGGLREAKLGDSAVAEQGPIDRDGPVEAGNGDRPGGSGGAESYPWASGEGASAVPAGTGGA